MLVEEGSEVLRVRGQWSRRTNAPPYSAPVSPKWYTLVPWTSRPCESRSRLASGCLQRCTFTSPADVGLVTTNACSKAVSRDSISAPVLVGIAGHRRRVADAPLALVRDGPRLPGPWRHADRSRTSSVPVVREAAPGSQP